LTLGLSGISFSGKCNSFFFPNHFYCFVRWLHLIILLFLQNPSSRCGCWWVLWQPRAWVISSLVSTWCLLSFLQGPCPSGHQKTRTLVIWVSLFYLFHSTMLGPFLYIYLGVKALSRKGTHDW
jgi:hypothetical protein